MDTISIALGLILALAAFSAAQIRILFPYILVLCLGLEYFSPEAEQSGITIPRAGFVVLLLAQLVAGRFSLRYSSKGMIWPLALFAAYYISSTIWSIDSSTSAERVVTIISLIIVFTVVLNSTTTPRQLNHYLLAFVVYALANAVMVMYQQYSGTASYVDQLGARGGGLGVNPNEGAHYIGWGFCILLAFHLSPGHSPAWVRNYWVRIILLGVLVAGLLGTVSRSGILATGIAGGLTYMLAHFGEPRKSRLLLQFTLVVLVIVGAIFFLPDMADLVVGRMGAAQEDQLGERLIIWQGAWHFFLSNPWFGYGLNCAGLLTAQLATEKVIGAVHNTPYSLLLDGGVCGMSFCLWLLWRLGSLLKRIISQRDPNLRVQGICLTGALLVTGGMMMAGDYQLNKLLWVLLGCVEAAYALGQKRRALAFQSAVGVGTHQCGQIRPRSVRTGILRC